MSTWNWAMVGTLALVIIVGIPFCIWYWKLVDRDAPPLERRFPEKPDRRERVEIDAGPGEGASVHEGDRRSAGE